MCMDSFYPYQINTLSTLLYGSMNRYTFLVQLPKSDRFADKYMQV